MLVNVIEEQLVYEITFHYKDFARKHPRGVIFYLLVH